MDKLRFNELCRAAADIGNEKKGIGTLGEKTLHSVLKAYFEPNEDNHEIKVGGFVADIVGEDGIIEIQTRQLYRLNKKLDAFLEFCDVTVVYPLCAIKYVRWLDIETGALSPRKKSPKKEGPHDLFRELYNVKYVLDNPRFSFCAVYIEAEDIRYLNGRDKTKKKGSSRCDRIPLSLVDEIIIRDPSDLRQFIPEGLPDEFTADIYAERCRIKRDLAVIELNVLCTHGLAEVLRKESRKNIYTINDKPKG